MQTPRFEDRLLPVLRQLYGDYGYLQYKVSKFEEYDLYARNKNFLSSEQVLTFTDSDGRLMALKPDVTLSIIKNTTGDEVRKLFYSESVYRAPRGGSFREIPQAGLECIGATDPYSAAEVVMLAAKSLALISQQYVLDLSDLRVLSGVLAQSDEDTCRQVLAAFGQKNRTALRAVTGLSDGTLALLEQLLTACGTPGEVLPRLRALPLPQASLAALEELELLVSLLGGWGLSQLRLDFSVVNDMDYYNGLVFRGFVSDVPTGVLCGGRYDNLMEKMGKGGGAIGFAVYLDELSGRRDAREEYDVDTLVLYDAQTDPFALQRAVEDARQSGSVRAQMQLPQALSRRRLVDLREVPEC